MKIHKKCKGVVQKIWSGINETQWRCAYCHKEVLPSETEEVKDEN